MADAPPYDLPLEALRPGDHAFAYALDDAFFARYDSELVRGGDFDVALDVSRVGNQFTLGLHVAGSAAVTCDRCLGAFELPLDVRDEVVVKLDNGPAREEEEVIYLPFGTERLDVAKVIFDAVGLALPMRISHEVAGLPCDPSVTRYLDAPAAAPGAGGTELTDPDIPEDSPWSALRELRVDPSDN